MTLLKTITITADLIVIISTLASTTAKGNEGMKKILTAFSILMILNIFMIWR